MAPLTWKTEKRKVADLKHYEKNPRKITPAAMAKLKDRIQKRGFHDVVKIDTENTVLSGNMRTEALTQLGIKEVNVLVPSRKLTVQEAQAVVLESNRNDGTWDDTMLPQFDTEVLLEVGFDSVEVDLLKETDEDEEDKFDTDKAVEAIKKPISKLGDVWQLGEHRLMCGSSTNPAELDALLGGEKADMVFTDPPYNMNISGKQGKILNDDMGEEAFVDFALEFMAQMRDHTKAGAPFYICSGYSSYIPFTYAMKAVGLEFANPIIWVKNSLGMGMNDYRHQHEMVLKAHNKKKKKSAAYTLRLERRQALLQRCTRRGRRLADRQTRHQHHGPPHSETSCSDQPGHKEFKQEGGSVLDMFGGSGATLIGAHKTGRKAYLMELDPKYCDVIRMRWEALTGEKAEKI